MTDDQALPFNESTIEAAALSWFGELGYAVARGSDLAPGEAAAERASFGDVVLAGRLREAIDRLNPKIPAEARNEALRKLLLTDSPSLVSNNRKFHQRLRDGVEVEYRRDDGSIAGDHVRLIDFDDPANSDWLAVNQFTVIEGQHNRRLPDPRTVVFFAASFLHRSPCDAISLHASKAGFRDARGEKSYAGTVERLCPGRGSINSYQ